MIDPNKPGNVFCKGRPNPMIAQMLDDWLFDCRMAREAQVNQIAHAETAAPAQLVAEVEEVTS